MSDKYNIVITVRLSDVAEVDQPDPLCLPVDEVATWRHFGSLLQSMYRNPPADIKVSYLDDESDWIELDSDLELKEAVRVAQRTDGILQLQVKRQDKTQHTYYESTLSERSTSTSSQSQSTSPSAPSQETHCSGGSPWVTYPHPYPPTCHMPNLYYPYSPQPPSPIPATGRLVYPSSGQSGPIVTSSTRPENACLGGNENVIYLQADGKTSYIPNDSNTNSDYHGNDPIPNTDERVRRLGDRLTSRKESEEESLKGLNTCLSFREMFEQASAYSSEQKVKFMKTMIAAGHHTTTTDEVDMHKDGEQEKRERRGRKAERKSSQNDPELLVELVSSTHSNSNKSVLQTDGNPSGKQDPPSPTSLAVQDPFEVVCHDKPSQDLEEVQLNMQPGSILKPEKSPSPPRESMCVGGSCSRPAAAVASVPPIPLLYTMQMMDGAQSGANAVAIEIPEGDNHGAAQKEEDVMASGGASCTTASAETGEVTGNRLCQDGAAVGDKPVSGASTTKPSLKKSKKRSDTSPSKAHSTKTSEKSSSKSKKESSTSKVKDLKKMKESSGEVQKVTIKEKIGLKTEADVESGEKIAKKKKSKGSTLHTKDFVKLITKMQAELHSGIVKDVGKQTDKLLKKTFSRSISHDSSRSLTRNSEVMPAEVVHRGIYCDSCNLTIRGIRYKCGNCPDFDFCEKCEASQNHHDPSHVFLKLDRPAPLAGRVDDQNIPLLKEFIYKDEEDLESVLAMKEVIRKPKIECIEDVPILSISEVTTPGQKESPPSTPSESHRKTDVSNWVWDSTFDTDKKPYLVEADGASGAGRQATMTTTTSNQAALGDSEMMRLYTLLTIQADKAAKRANDDIEDYIVELSKLSSVPEMAESVHSLSTLLTTNLVADADSTPLLTPPPTTTPAETSSPVEVVEEMTLTMVQKESLVYRPETEGREETPEENIQDEDDVESQASSAEFLDADEDEEEEDDGEDVEEEGIEAFEEVEVDDDDVNGRPKEKAEEEVSDFEPVDHHSDSDTSDDFCVLDPPSGSDAGETEQGEGDKVHPTPEVPSMEIVDHVRAEGEAANFAVAVLEDINGQEETSPVEEMAVAEEKIEAVLVQRPESAVVAVETQMVEGDIDENYVDDCRRKVMEAHELDGEAKKEIEEKKEAEDMPAEMTYSTQDDILMKMSGEERCRFLEMVKSLRDRADDLEKELKIRKEAEVEEKERKEAEANYQLILEEKQKEAVRENEKLEQHQKKKEQEERSKRQQRLQEKEKERKMRQKKTNKELKLSPGGSMGEGAKKKTRVASSSGTKPLTLMQMALNKDKEGRKSSRTSSTNTAPAATTVKHEKEVGTAVSSPGSLATPDNVIYMSSEKMKKDADSQTNGRVTSGAEAAAQASQMIQNVATGVHKAAEAAFHTAKDVFYSLQAKQVEKKTYDGVVYSKTIPIDSKASSTDATTTTNISTTANTTIPTSEPKSKQEKTKQESERESEMEAAWVPPSSVWTPPADTFVPPKSEWTPPKNDWQPRNVNWVPPKSEWTNPKSEWTNPKSEWTPPQDYYQQPTLEATISKSSDSSNGKNDKKVPTRQERNVEAVPKTEAQQCDNKDSTVTSSSAVPLPHLPPIQITDPILRREVQGMQLLIEMGFANREQNRRLLQEYEGDVEKAVQSLLQEEREEHWAWGQRH